MKQHILSHIAARNAPPGRYGDGAGLWLHKRERARGKARGKWVLRYFLKGRRREMGLGPLARCFHRRCQGRRAETRNIPGQWVQLGVYLSNWRYLQRVCPPA